MAIGLSACHDGDLPGANKGEKGFGRVHLQSLTVDLTNAENILNNNVESRSSRSIDMSGFRVEIWDVIENELVNEWSYEEMPEIFELEVGDYKAVVYNKVTADADFDAPYFYGESPFTITLNHVTDVDKVVCKLANIKVSIRFSKKLYDLLQDDAKVNVSCGSSSLLFGKDETRSGYFKAKSDRLFVRFEGTINGQVETHFLDLQNVAPGQHRIITYDLKDPNIDPGNETGQVDPNGISIDTEVEDEDLTATAGNSEPNIEDPDQPGKEDPKDDPNKPDDPTPPTPPAENTIEITAIEPLSFDHANNITDLHSAIVNIVAPKGITNFIVHIQTDNEGFESAFSEFIPFQFDLTTAQAYPTSDGKDYSATFTNFGFPIKDKVTDTTYDKENPLVFNITPFLDPLGGFEGEHKFTLTVKDKSGQEMTKTLVIIVK